MNFIEGIEGDYIETKNNNLFFDVKGLLHPNDRKICFLRFYPDPDGDRVKNDISFTKVYDLNQRYSYLKENFPEYLFHSKELDIELQGVLNDDIKKIHTPRDYFKKLSTKENNISILETHSLKLCELFIQEGGLPKNSIGISGSPMVGLNKEDSDIDLIIYGTKECLEFQNRLKKILESSKICRKYTSDEYKIHFKNRFGGSNLTFEEFIRSEKNKLHQGKYNGIEYFIRYIKSPEDWEGKFYDYNYKNCGRIEIKAEIIESNDSIFTPCTYKIKVQKIIDENVNIKELNIKDIHEVSSFRGRYCEQALKGNNVFVEGKLEQVSYKDEKSYYRILLTDQKRDRMILVI